jgi:hypothetical protein
MLDFFAQKKNHMILPVRWSYRKFATIRRQAQKGVPVDAKIRVIKQLTAEAQVFSRHSPMNPKISSIVDFYGSSRLSEPDRTGILNVIMHHPHLDFEACADSFRLTPSEIKRFHLIHVDCGKSFIELVAQCNETQIGAKYIHTDLLLKRDSKQQVTMLIDKTEAEKTDMTSFYLCQVDTSVTKSILSRANGFDKSLIFINLAETLGNESPILASCTRCGQISQWTENVPSYICQTANCTPDILSYSKQSVLNPGGGRHYWGPVVPNLRNVWMGLIEKKTKTNRTDSLGILTATVFQVLKDPSSGRSKKVNLPSPDPRVQWCILPIHSSNSSS